MKKVLFTSIILISVIYKPVTAQKHSCCTMSGSDAFAMLGSEAGFKSMHASPEPLDYQAKKGMMVSFSTPDGQTGSAFMVPAYKKTDNYLFVIHEWWGLNDYIKREAEQFAEELQNVNVMAIDLYDGQVATNADDAGKIMQSIKPERAEAIIKGAIGYIRANAAIQTVGWCFGGGWSLQAAILAGNKTKGCVMYYGMPEKDASKLKKFNAPVLGIFATKDGWINKDVVGNFEKQMKSLKKPLEVHWYEADHAFANPSNPHHDAEATASARKLTLDFIRKNFE